MELQKDERWSIFVWAEDSDSFKSKIVPEISFKSNVSTDVIKSFEVVKKLLIHSYYEYEFWDVAANKALQTFEMALRIRYKELNATEWDKTLQKLIEWFHVNNHFEITNTFFLDKIREVRNYYAHPKQYSLSGPTVKHLIESSMDLINDLYEDATLRLIRRQYALDLTNRFNELLKEGAILKIDGERVIIQHLGVMFIDNKENPMASYLILITLFEPSQYYNVPYNPNKRFFYQIATKEVDFHNSNSCTITSIDLPNKIYLDSIVDKSEKEAYDDWKQRFKTDQEYFIMESKIRLMMSDYSIQLRRLFHKK